MPDAVDSWLAEANRQDSQLQAEFPLLEITVEVRASNALVPSVKGVPMPTGSSS